jgi:hypothetical protein
LPKEEQIPLHLLVHNRVTVQTLLQQIEPDHFTDDRFRQIFNLYVESGKQTGAAMRIQPDAADPRLSPILTALMVQEPDYDDWEQTLKDCIRMLRVKKIRLEMKTLENEIRDAEKVGNSPQIKLLLDKLVGLKKMSLEVGS